MVDFSHCCLLRVTNNYKFNVMVPGADFPNNYNCNNICEIAGHARKELQHWEGALSDLSQAQTIDFDPDTVEILKFLTEKHVEQERQDAKERIEHEEKLKKRASDIKKAQQERAREEREEKARAAGAGGMPGGMGGMPGTFYRFLSKLASLWRDVLVLFLWCFGAMSGLHSNSLNFLFYAIPKFRVGGMGGMPGMAGMGGKFFALFMWSQCFPRVTQYVPREFIVF